MYEADVKWTAVKDRRCGFCFAWVVGARAVRHSGLFRVGGAKMAKKPDARLPVQVSESSISTTNVDVTTKSTNTKLGLTWTKAQC